MLQVVGGEMDSNDNIQVQPHAMIMILLTRTNNVTSNLFAAITIDSKVLFNHKPLKGILWGISILCSTKNIAHQLLVNNINFFSH